MDHIREGKHGARSTKQAIAIGLSKARRAGVKLPPPKQGAASAETRRRAKSDSASASKSRNAVARDKPGAQARGQKRGKPDGAVQARQGRRQETYTLAAIGSGAQGRANPETHGMTA